MKLFQGLINSLGYVTEASLEIFSPNHDSYLPIGVQPYFGEIYRPAKKSHYSKPVAKISQPK